MTNFSQQTFTEWSKYTPVKVKTLEDLIPFGILPTKEYEQIVKEQRTAPYQLKILQPRENKWWKKDPWYYTINEYNFRDHWNFDDARKRIGFFGCSFTAGEGIESSKLHVNIVSQHYNLNVFNFGSGGSSIDRVARTFSAVNGLINLDYAVITLPAWHRQLHIGNRGDMINLLPSHPHVGYKKLNKIMSSLHEEYYATRAASNINWIYDIAKYKNIKILFSSWDPDTNLFCKMLLPDNTIELFPNIDDGGARDKMHPGPKSQAAHAEQIIKALDDKTWI